VRNFAPFTGIGLSPLPYSLKWAILERNFIAGSQHNEIHSILIKVRFRLLEMFNELP
jgi:hypothetical protein